MIPPEETDELLREIPEFYALALGEYWPSGPSNGKSSEKSLGLRVDALSGRVPKSALLLLEAWEIDWRETLSTFSGDKDAVRSQRRRKSEQWHATKSTDMMGIALVGVIDFLRSHLVTAYAEHGAIEDFVSEIKDVHKIASGSARVRGPDKAVIECPADTETGICGQKLVLSGSDVDCDKCGSTWNEKRLLLVARYAGTETWQPAAVVSEYLGIPDRTLRHWAAQGHVLRQGSHYLWSSVVDYQQTAQKTREGTLPLAENAGF